ncbi:MAG: hypothetical protein D4R65_02020, partial [Verrucomicrobiaceae bacterium]
MFVLRVLLLRLLNNVFLDRMREQFLAQAKANGLHGENLLRELLQWEILAALHSVEAFKEVAFV